MSAFLLFSPMVVFHGNTGNPLAGGSLKFFDAGTTTPRVVYGNKALTVNNGTTVTLDSAGRTAFETWGRGNYFFEAIRTVGQPPLIPAEVNP